MALTAKVLQVTLPHGGDATTVDATSSGFGTPDAVLVFAVSARSGTNPNSVVQSSIGVWDGTDQACIGWYAVDNADTTLTSRYIRDGSVLVFASWNGTSHTILARFTISNITDGVRLTLAEDGTTVNRTATVVLLKGVTGKKVGVTAHDGAGGTVNVTAPGFQPDLVFYLTNGLASGTDDSSAQYGTFGVAHNDGSTLTQHCVSWASTTGVGTSVVNNSVNDDCIGRVYYNDGSISRKDTISDFDSSGFSITPSSGTPASRFIYLALKLPDPDDAYVAIKDSKTLTTGTQAYTGAGFTPILLGLFGNTDTSTNSTSSTPSGGMSFGWADATVEQSLIFCDEDNEGTSDVVSRYDSDDILNLRLDDDAVDAVAAFSSFDSDGWTLNYSDPSSSARKMLAFALGNSVTAVTLSPGKGAVTHTGKAPTVARTANQTVSPGKATVTATGKAPVVARTQHQWVAPGKGAVTAAGKQPAVARQANQWVVPGKGAVTHTGRQPTLTQGATTTVVPGKGTITCAGKQPTVAQTAHQTVAPAKGAVTHSGRQPTVARTAHQSVAPAKAALTVAGKTPVVLQGLTTSVAPNKGAIVYTGRQPALAQTTHNVVQPGKAAAVYTGRQPAIVSSGHQTIIPGKGALLFTGYRPGVIGRQPIGRTPAGRIIAIGAPDRHIAIGAPGRTVYVED
jgi:hypothetical protein